MPAKRREVLAGYAIRRRDIPDYFTPDFAVALGAWSDFKRFGLPYSGGYAEQPAPIMNAIRLLDSTFNEWQESKRKHGSGRA